MHYIVVYDVAEERVNKVCKFLKRYLPRIQNSVFEGELSEGKFEALRLGLLERIDPSRDAILVWALRDAKWANRQVIGTEKLPVSRFL